MWRVTRAMLLCCGALVLTCAARNPVIYPEAASAPFDGKPLRCRDSRDCPEELYCSRPGCDGRGRCEPKPVIVNDVFSPVCACNGRTYGNDQSAHADGFSVSHQLRRGESSGRRCEPHFVCRDHEAQAGVDCGPETAICDVAASFRIVQRVCADQLQVAFFFSSHGPVAVAEPTELGPTTITVQRLSDSGAEAAAPLTTCEGCQLRLVRDAPGTTPRVPLEGVRLEAGKIRVVLETAFDTAPECGNRASLSLNRTLEVSKSTSGCWAIEEAE